MSASAPSEIHDSQQRTRVITDLALGAGQVDLKTDKDESITLDLDGSAPPSAQLRLRTGQNQWSDGERRIPFELHGAQFELVAQCRADPERAHEVLATDLRLFSQNQRRMPRVDVSELGARVAWKARGRRGEGRVLDASNHGLSVSFEPEQAPKAGEQICLELEISGQSFGGVAQVLRCVPEGSSTRVALSFTPANDDMRLSTLLLGLRFGCLKERWQVSDGSMRTLFERTGYAALRPGIGISESWLQLKHPELTQDRVFLDAAGKTVGHLSQTRAYTHTWVGHQLATYQRHEDIVQAWLALYRFGAALPLLVDGDDAMQIAYFDPKKRWHQKFFDGFVAWIQDPGHAGIVRLDRFDVSADRGPATKHEGCLATNSELPLVADIARAQLGDLAAKALDIRSDRLRSECLHPAYEDTNILRSREVMVLKQEGTISAVALLERGSPDLNAFGLFDMAQVFVPQGANIPVEAISAFLQTIVSWYEDRGVPNPIVVAPEGSIGTQPHPQLTFVETTGLMTWSAQALRHYENYLQYTFGRRPRRRGQSGPLAGEYSKRVTEARIQLVSCPAVQAVLSPELDDATMLAFLIEHATRSVAMTEPVEGWIARAGDQCLEVGLPRLAESLRQHAKGEANHHLMLIDDATILVQAWNQRFPQARLYPKELLGRLPSPANNAYAQMHEDIICGDEPYRQVAIELEIERLSVSAGSSFLARAQTLLGADVEGLSFMSEHVKLDVGHTAANERMLSRLLGASPEFLPALVETGIQALQTYQAFIEECFEEAQRRARYANRARGEPQAAT